MKKMKIFALMLLAGVAMFSSCKKDETLAPAEISVTNNKTSYTIYFSTAADSTILFNVTVAAEAKIETFKIQKTVGSTTTNWGSPAAYSGETSYTYNFSNAFAETETYPQTFKFTVTDKDGNEASISVTINKSTPASGNPIYTFSPTPLGAQNAAEGSFFASVAGTGTVYSQSQAAANAANIYITYGVIGTTPTIMSLPERGNNGFTAVTGGPTVYYKLSSITPAEFDAMTNDLGFANITASTTPKVDVSAGNVYEFVNGSKKGLIKVTAITAGTSGTMTMVVKVQQ